MNRFASIGRVLFLSGFVDCPHEAALFACGGALVKRRTLGSFIDKALGRFAKFEGVVTAVYCCRYRLLHEGFDHRLARAVGHAAFERLAVTLDRAFTAALGLCGFALLTWGLLARWHDFLSAREDSRVRA